MPKKKKNTKIMNPVQNDKMCPIVWDRNEYGVCILTMENAHHADYLKPTFYVPLRTFMQCGAFWSALNLCTVFWEPPLYGIPRAHVENERIKGAYLIEFASDLAPVCKEWARTCIEQCNQCNQKASDASDEVFVEIVLFNEARKAQMMDAVSRHELNVSTCESTNVHTVNI